MSLALSPRFRARVPAVRAFGSCLRRFGLRRVYTRGPRQRMTRSRQPEAALHCCKSRRAGEEGYADFEPGAATFDKPVKAFATDYESQRKSPKKVATGQQRPREPRARVPGVALFSLVVFFVLFVVFSRKCTAPKAPDTLVGLVTQYSERPFKSRSKLGRQLCTSFSAL